MVEVLVIMNNYLHDVATAFLASSALLMLVVAKLLPEKAGPQVIDYFLAVYRKFTLTAKVSLLWILIGGVPRVIYYKRIEWIIALDNRIIPALMVKHVIMFVLVIIGCISWWRLSNKVKAVATMR
ncbi:MAG: hypothetical protein ACYC21_09100 [Eubacteriales bacterium]